MSKLNKLIKFRTDMKIKILLCILFLLLFINLVSASLEIKLNKETFYSGDTVMTDIIVKNEETNKVDYIMTYSISGEGSVAMPVLIDLKLEAGETKHFYSNFSLEDVFQSENYTVSARIYGGNNTLLFKDLKTFEVISKDVRKKFQANLFICEDEKCEIKNKVFIKGQNIYIKLDSEIENLEINSSIKSPSNNIEKLIFENKIARFELKETGSYSIFAEALKEGYFPVTISEEFAVISQEPEIKDERICNADGKCEGKENYQNCPQDCKKKELEIGKKISYYLLVITLVLIIIVIAVLLIKKLLEKRHETGQEEFTKI